MHSLSLCTLCPDALFVLMHPLSWLSWRARPLTALFAVPCRTAPDPESPSWQEGTAHTDTAGHPSSVTTVFFKKRSLPSFQGTHTREPGPDCPRGLGEAKTAIGYSRLGESLRPARSASGNRKHGHQPRVPWVAGR